MKRILFLILSFIFLSSVSYATDQVIGGGGTSLPTCEDGQVATFSVATGLWDTCAANAAATGITVSGTPANHYWAGWVNDASN